MLNQNQQRGLIFSQNKKPSFSRNSTKIAVLKIKVIEDETKQRLVNLKPINLNYQQLEHELIAMFDDNESKAFIMNFLKQIRITSVI